MLGGMLFTAHNFSLPLKLFNLLNLVHEVCLFSHDTVQGCILSFKRSENILALNHYWVPILVC